MKVYVVLYRYHDDCFADAVFTTLEAAKEYLAKERSCSLFLSSEHEKPLWEI